MNNRVFKEFSDFILSGQELLCLEKALYTLLDEYKSDRISQSGGRFHLNYNEIIDQCFTKLRLHENYLKNSNFFVIAIPEHDPDPILELLGEDVEKVQDSTRKRAQREMEREKKRKKSRSKQPKAMADPPSNQASDKAESKQEKTAASA